MASEEHLAILRQGVWEWYLWRRTQPKIRPNLSEADLSYADLTDADLSGADLSQAKINRADLSGADLSQANLSGADLNQAKINRADLSYADLREANLSGANLSGADLSQAKINRANLSGANLSRVSLRGIDLSGADLSGANLSYADLTSQDLSYKDLSGVNLSGVNLTGANLIGTNFTGATLTDCRIFGIAAWNVQLQGAIQNNLIITPPEEPIITVDNLKIAQFIYLLLNNAEIREVIDTITSKVVLILGRFTPERKAVLDALREALRQHNYLPILFDFGKTASRDLTETVSTLAHLARFIIVDLTDPSSAPHEVAMVIPQTVVPVLPLLSREPLLVDGKVVERREYAMFQDLRQRYGWVLPTYRYIDQAHLLATLKEQVIEPAERKAQEFAKR